jgi:hypothetical protein
MRSLSSVSILSLSLSLAGLVACGAGSDSDGGGATDPTTTPGSPTGSANGGAGGTTAAPCAPADPQLIADNEPAPTAIVADGTHVYWLRYETRTLVRAPAAGGAVEEVLSGVGSYDLAIDDENVYAASTKGLVAVNKTTLATSKVGDAVSTRGVAVRAGNVAWETFGVTLRAKGQSAKKVRPTSGVSSGFRNVAIDDATIYDATGASKVARFGFDGKALDPLPLPSGASLRVGDAHVFSVKPSGVTPGVSFVPKAGGAVTTIDMGELVDDKGERRPFKLVPYDLAIDGDELYVLSAFGVQWARVGDTSFRAMQKTGTVSGASPEAGNNAIAVNPTHVFWTGSLPDFTSGKTRGQVFRIARCK